ncbi:hypothetical protein CENSYa_0009 [Cenarchaeum symbiosum A]|uniref:Uncharacterized protein n=1 Tax=Cenarchaeum symbiosum (strain A) TaxID=414004 RepID=A0RTK0_CENSY|nr:hypothetical protein CENSYa_0009 [Cenarchaeum symbiosum A]
MQSKMELITNVLKIRTYAMIAVVGAAGLGTLYYFLTMSMLHLHFGPVMEISPWYITTSITLTVVISALAGVNFAMMAYKIRRARMMNSVKSNSSAILGGAFAAFTPGCPACTAPLAVILGAVGGLSLFPMQGLELKFISVGALLFSVYWITRNMQNSCCKVKQDI